MATSYSQDPPKRLASFPSTANAAMTQTQNKPAHKISKKKFRSEPAVEALVFVIDQAGNLRYLNSQFEQLAGMSSEHILGEHWSSVFSADNDGNLEDHTAWLMSHDLPIQCEWRLNTSSKKTLSLSVTLTRMRSQSVDNQFELWGIARPHFRFNQRLPLRILPDAQGSEEGGIVLAEVLEQLNEGVIVFFSGQNVIANSRAKQILKLGENSGVECEKLELPPIFAKHLAVALNCGRDEFEFSLPTFGNMDFTSIQATVTKSNRHGLVSDHLVVILRDLTERREIEAKLQTTAEQLSRSNRDLNQFAQVASHDLKEPLRTISIFTTLLSRRYSGQMGKEADEYIGYAVGGACRMMQLIDDLLAYSQINRTNKPAFVNTEKLVSQLLTDLKSTLDADVSIRCKNLPRVWGNEFGLVQVFENLIANAVKFRGTRRLEIEVAAEAVGNFWRFSVADNGIGIAPECQERIFLIFQRLHRQEEYSGTGIGLAICQKVVQDHGGQIWVSSQLGKGSTFYFTLPCEKPWTDVCSKSPQ